MGKLVAAMLVVFTAGGVWAADSSMGIYGHAAAVAGNYESSARDLGLTVEQKLKLRRIDENAKKVLRPLYEDLAGQVGDLKKLVNERAEDEKLNVQLTIIRSTESVIEAKNSEVQKQKETVLTVSQRVQLALWKAELTEDWTRVYFGGNRDKKRAGKKEEPVKDSGKEE